MPEEKAKPPVYQYFELVKTGTHEKMTAAGAVSVSAQWFKCKRGSKCKVKHKTESGLIKCVSKGTGPLLEHIKACEGVDAWLDVRSKSKGSRVKQRADGSFILKFSFKELLPHHVRWVIYCFREWDHFVKSRKATFKDWLEGYETRARMPHQQTSRKLLYIIKGLISKKLHALLARIKEMVGAPFAGFLDDIWSKRNCKQSFACARTPLGIDGDLLDEFIREFSSASSTSPTSYAGTVVSCSPVLAFSTLPEARHTGHVIARWKRETLEKTKVMTVTDISLATEDGASNNKKSNKILRMPSKICTPHDLQRCVLLQPASRASLAATRSSRSSRAEAARWWARFRSLVWQLLRSSTPRTRTRRSRTP